MPMDYPATGSGEGVNCDHLLNAHGFPYYKRHLLSLVELEYINLIPAKTENSYAICNLWDDGY